MQLLNLSLYQSCRSVNFMWCHTYHFLIRLGRIPYSMPWLSWVVYNKLKKLNWPVFFFYCYSTSLVFVLNYRCKDQVSLNNAHKAWVKRTSRTTKVSVLVISFHPLQKSTKLSIICENKWDVIEMNIGRLADETRKELLGMFSKKTHGVKIGCFKNEANVSRTPIVNRCTIWLRDEYVLHLSECPCC